MKAPIYLQALVGPAEQLLLLQLPCNLQLTFEGDMNSGMSWSSPA